jgi:hypothetical protein
MATTKEKQRAKSKRPKRPNPLERAAESVTFKRPRNEKIITKTADSKGRVVLGGQYANRAVILQTLSETEIIIKMARVIPESEAWLYENPAAIDAVRKGLAEARAGKVMRGQNLDADAKIVAELHD